MLQPDASTNVMWKHTNPEGKLKIKVSPRQKSNPLQQKSPQEEDTSNQTSNHHVASPLISPSYFGGRWTAHRADYKKVNNFTYAFMYYHSFWI